MRRPVLRSARLRRLVKPALKAGFGRWWANPALRHRLQRAIVCRHTAARPSPGSSSSTPKKGMAIGEERADVPLRSFEGSQTAFESEHAEGCKECRSFRAHSGTEPQGVRQAQVGKRRAAQAPASFHSPAHEGKPFPFLGPAFYSAMWGAKAAPRKANYPQHSISNLL